MLTDESFINYCKGSSPADTARWESYLLANPLERRYIEEAKDRFMALFTALAISDREEQETRLLRRMTQNDEAPVFQMQVPEGKKTGNRFSRLFRLVAAAVVMAILSFFAIDWYNKPSAESLKVFECAYGERKNLQLPDGSVVILNSGSKMKIRDDYGVSARDIYLEGEAFFDVKHNRDIAFIVHTPAMDVRAVGTAFNVKAYPGEKVTEASLVRGLVEVTLKKEQNRKLILHPNEKVQWSPQNQENGHVSGANLSDKEKTTNSGSLQSLTKTDGDEIKEIAWIENKLVFADESFEDIAILLERWYGVKIAFADDMIRHYRFTGSFEKEKIETVLAFLKESKNFNYEIIPGDTLTVKLFK